MAHIREEPASAHWMHPEDLDDPAFTYGAGKIFLGAARQKEIGIHDDRHILTIAGSRSGKSSTSLMPNLLRWPSSVLCIDPKGELARDSAVERAKMGQDVYILDPFGEVTGEAAQYRCGYNPLNELIHADQDDIVDDAAMIAEALIIPDKGGDQHWTLSAKNLIRGLLLFILKNGGADASLTDLREIVTSPMNLVDNPKENDPPSLSAYFRMMTEDRDTFAGTMAGVGGTMLGKPDNEGGSIISTAVEQTSFLDSSKLKNHLEAPGLTTLRQLKRKPTTIYLVLPASRMATHSRWLRLILVLAMAALEREPLQLPLPDPSAPKRKPSVLFILEEFPQLGYMRQLESAAGLMAGFDVKLWTIIQDLSQIKALYKESWETFIGNAGIIEAFGNSDTTTTKYLSERIGMTLAKVIQSENLSIEAQKGGQSREREVIQTSPLIAPFELTQRFSRSANRKLVLTPEHPPFSVRRVHWDKK